MAAAKAAADDASGIAGSTLVTVMHLNGNQFGLRVFGLGQCWFTAPLAPEATQRGRLRDGWMTDDLAYVGGGSLITETIGRGGMAAAAMPLREHSEYRIPALAYRGVPCGTSASPA